MAERERWGNSDTFSNSVDKALGCKLRGMSERQQPRAKILHTLTTGGAWTPPPGSALDHVMHWPGAGGFAVSASVRFMSKDRGISAVDAPYSRRGRRNVSKSCTAQTRIEARRADAGWRFGEGATSQNRTWCIKNLASGRPSIILVTFLKTY